MTSPPQHGEGPDDLRGCWLAQRVTTEISGVYCESEFPARPETIGIFLLVQPPGGGGAGGGWGFDYDLMQTATDARRQQHALNEPLPAAGLFGCEARRVVAARLWNRNDR